MPVDESDRPVGHERVAEEQPEERAIAERPSPQDDPYAVLGVQRTASDADVRHAFRKLVSQHHPDKLAARGSAPEVIKLAQQRTQQILAAYENIRTARGMKS